MANQIWAMYITYVPIEGGSLYLCAVVDWYSRAVLAWELSNTLDARFCVEVVQRAIDQYGLPEIFNTDQGLSNVFVERLWLTEELPLAGGRVR